MDFNPTEAMEALTGMEKIPENQTKEATGSTVFPKYQWSCFVEGGQKEQFVVRSNDMNDFKIAVKAIKTSLPVTTTQSTIPATRQPQPTGLASTCAVHNVPMMEGFSKKTNQPYWYHDDNAGTRCFGKGFIQR